MWILINTPMSYLMENLTLTPLQLGSTCFNLDSNSVLMVAQWGENQNVSYHLMGKGDALGTGVLEL